MGAGSIVREEEKKKNGVNSLHPPLIDAAFNLVKYPLRLVYSLCGIRQPVAAAVRPPNQIKTRFLRFFLKKKRLR